MTNEPSGNPPPGYYQQPPKKKRVWPWVFGGIILAIFLGVGACVVFIGAVATDIDKEAERQVTVTYQVEGSANSASVLYSGHDFNTAQDTGVTLPWTKQVTIDGLGKTVTLTATNDESGGAITCRILADGKQVSEQTANGPFASASCMGDAGQE